jgi:flavin-dependent dehydrogenase
MTLEPEHDVVVIGAGPSGAIAAALLHRRGWRVLVLEAQKFPRFVVGESLLAHCLDFLEEAGMLDAVNRAGYQFKDGAAFIRGPEYSDIHFSDQFSPGYDHAYEVDRASFDKLLADEAAKQGVEIRYEHRVVGFEHTATGARLTAQDANGGQFQIAARFVLDASGFGRTLAKLLDLEMPSTFPVRVALVTHVTDVMPLDAFDRAKVQVIVHPRHEDVWYWLIPFPNNRCSIGCVATREFHARYPTETKERLQAMIAEEPFLSRILVNAEWHTPVREIAGYTASVRTMHGPAFALLGNAAEFLDPVFSSGVAIGMRSASVAAQVLDRQLRGETVDWARDFEVPLRNGVGTFRVYVEAWYDGRFQKVMFAKNKTPGIRKMISSVLAGYAWDESNPFVADAERRLNMLAALCG